jgi:hypothetical protein
MENEETIPGEHEAEEARASAGEMWTSGEPSLREPGRMEMVRAPAPSIAVAPRIKAGDLVARLDVISQAMDQAMKDGLDYGVIPGTSKPTLLKPGAEKLGVLFELDIQLDNGKVWDGDHLTVVSRATVFHAPSGTRLGYGEGICTTRERKYAKRTANRKCPDCQAEAILQSRNEGEGFFCWRKRGGCGNKFSLDDERITRQETGEIENPDLPDTWNTVVKIAEKRARVDAVLAVTGASALFTQDAEDLPSSERQGSKSSDDLKTENATPKASSKGRAITAPQKGKITRLLKAKIPDPPDRNFHETIKATVRGGTSKDAGILIDALELLDETQGRNVATFLGRFNIEWTPPSDVPADTTELDAAEREEAEAIAEAQGEGADAVQRSLGVAGSDEG